MIGKKLSESEKEKIYTDLLPGESRKSLCRMHGVSSHVMYEWVKKNNSQDNERTIEPIEVIGSGERYFAKVVIGVKQIYIGQSVTASYLNELQ